MYSGKQTAHTKIDFMKAIMKRVVRGKNREEGRV